MPRQERLQGLGWPQPLVAAKLERPQRRRQQEQRPLEQEQQLAQFLETVLSETVKISSN